MSDEALDKLRQMRRDGLRLYVDPDDPEKRILCRKECRMNIRSWHKEAIEAHRTAIFERLVYEQGLVLDGAETCSFCDSLDWPKPFPKAARLYIGQQIEMGESAAYVTSLYCQTCGDSRRKDRRAKEQKALGRPIEERERFFIKR